MLRVCAHPGKRSRNAALRDVGTRSLRSAGHTVELSVLHAMSWQPLLTEADFGDIQGIPSEMSRASKYAFEEGTLAKDIRAEEDKLLSCQAVILQFPLRWYSVPAILKGRIDRVFTKGFAYGVMDPNMSERSFRYGDRPLAGRRAQVITTVGSPPGAMGPRGVNGQLDQVLFSLLHNVLLSTNPGARPNDVLLLTT